MDPISWNKSSNSATAPALRVFPTLRNSLNGLLNHHVASRAAKPASKETVGGSNALVACTCTSSFESVDKASAVISCINGMAQHHLQWHSLQSIMNVDMSIWNKQCSCVLLWSLAQFSICSCGGSSPCVGIGRCKNTMAHY